jgi:hypothetical protein
MAHCFGFSCRFFFETGFSCHFNFSVVLIERSIYACQLLLPLDKATGHMLVHLSFTGTES